MESGRNPINDSNPSIQSPLFDPPPGWPPFHHTLQKRQTGVMLSCIQADGADTLYPLLCKENYTNLICDQPLQLVMLPFPIGFIICPQLIWLAELGDSIRRERRLLCRGYLAWPDGGIQKICIHSMHFISLISALCENIEDINDFFGIYDFLIHWEEYLD